MEVSGALNLKHILGRVGVGGLGEEGFIASDEASGGQGSGKSTVATLSPAQCPRAKPSGLSWLPGCYGEEGLSPQL